MQQEPGTLLLVDGDLRRAERLAGRLSGLGFEPEYVENGAAALLKAHDTRPDVVVLAAEMPVLDGFRTLDALRSTPQTCDIPVILITEGNSPQELSRGWNAGADLCIPRNHGEADVLATLYRALSNMRANEAPQRELALAS